MKAYPYLTEREKEVKKLLLHGYTNKQIADELIISINTAKAHVCNLLAKFKAKNRMQIALKEIEMLEQQLESQDISPYENLIYQIENKQVGELFAEFLGDHNFQIAACTN